MNALAEVFSKKVAVEKLANTEKHDDSSDEKYLVV